MLDRWLLTWRSHGITTRVRRHVDLLRVDSALCPRWSPGATFSPAGGGRIGATGSGLLLSRHQRRPAEAPDLTLAQIQQPIVKAYAAALPAGVRPAALDLHVGTPAEVIASLSADPGQEATLESIELVATEVAPALGWAPAVAAA